MKNRKRFVSKSYHNNCMEWAAEKEDAQCRYIMWLETLLMQNDSIGLQICSVVRETEPEVCEKTCKNMKPKCLHRMYEIHLSKKGA